MTNVSKEFRHNPLLALVPHEGNFKDLPASASLMSERLSEIDALLNSEQALDEKSKRLLTAEMDMLMTVDSWMGN